MRHHLKIVSNNKERDVFLVNDVITQACDLMIETAIHNYILAFSAPLMIANVILISGLLNVRTEP